MRKVLVCQHVPYEILGTLNPHLKQAGFRIRYVNFGHDPDATPGLEGYYGLIILGGPMGVDETKKHPFLKHEVKMIQEALYKNIPVLGICLGAQLIAKTLGAKVNPNPAKEIGWFDVSFTAVGKKDPLLKHCGAKKKIFQWHSDRFDIPKDAVRLASSATCENQAFRFGDKVYAFQFHLEVDAPMIHRWLGVSPNKEELQSLKETSATTIERETKRHIQKSVSLSHKVFESFTDLFGFEKKVRRLPSR